MNRYAQLILLDLAKASIGHGLAHQGALPISLEDYQGELARPGASFVTLKIAGRLRGCIGTLVPHRPLVTDVSENAYSAAFMDSRFPPVSASEFSLLAYHISVLGRPRPMSVISEQDLLSQLEEGVDGLILSEGSRRATFLPSVWEQLSDKREFVQHLKAKAGFPMDYWSDAIVAERYSVESFE